MIFGIGIIVGAAGAVFMTSLLHIALTQLAVAEQREEGR